MMSWSVFRKTQTAGYLCIVLSILNWSGNFVAARGLAELVEPAVLTLLRWGLAALLFTPFGLQAFWRERTEILRHFLPLSIIALCGVSLYDTIIFMAGHTSGALNMTLISTLSPLLTALAGQFFLRQQIGRRMYAGIVVSSLGVVLLVSEGSVERLASLRFARGDILILLTAVMSVVYNLTIKTVTARISQTALLMACCLFGTAYLIPIALWEGGGRLVLPELTVPLFGSLVYLAVFASILCYLFWNMAVEVLGAARTTMFYYTLPPLSGLAAWVLLGEQVTAVQMLSGCIILVGILFGLHGSRTSAAATNHALGDTESDGPGAH